MTLFQSHLGNTTAMLGLLQTTSSQAKQSMQTCGTNQATKPVANALSLPVPLQSQPAAFLARCPRQRCLVDAHSCGIVGSNCRVLRGLDVDVENLAPGRDASDGFHSRQIASDNIHSTTRYSVCSVEGYQRPASGNNRHLGSQCLGFPLQPV